ncbi:MAG: phosphatidate cytidylyltransferase [Chthoniobacteraceae bacterium]
MTGQKTTEGLYDFEIGTLLLFMLVVFGRQMFLRVEELVPLQTMALTLFGLLYIVWPFSFVTKIVYLPPRVDGHVTGHFYVLFLLLVTKFSDMGAYITGSLIGRHPLVPHISPKKTWEGFFGALAFSVGGGCGLLAVLPDRLGRLNYADAVMLGLVLGFAAIVGDLAESLVKRSCKVKDSGRFLPGIGGALDLIDSILFTAPVMFFYLRFFLR